MTPDLLPIAIAGKVSVDAAGCWIWNGDTTANGYGQSRIGRTTHKAHRVVYLALVGQVPDGLDLDQPVTRSENMWRSPLSGAKTHCHNGHEYTAENTLIEADGHRRCRACLRKRRRARYLRTRQSRST